jgi:tropomyosin, fungi type
LNAKVKTLELTSTSKDQEITSLTHRNELLEKKLEEHEEKLEKLKGLENDESGARGERESLLRKVSLLEEEAETNDKNLKETTEKYKKLFVCLANDRLRQVDVKAEHFERKVTSLERERDDLEKKLDEMTEKHRAAKAELDEVNAQLDNL